MPGGDSDIIGIDDLRAENQRLKARVYDLEEKVRQEAGKSKERETSQVTSVVKLLKQKDEMLGGLQEDLEQKNQRLESLVTELQGKNEELQLWISSLRLYQDIFENEPALMIGVNKEGKVVLYNKATTDYYGEAFAKYLFHDIADVDFSKLDPYIPTLVHEVLNSHKKVERKVSKDGKDVESSGFPIKGGETLRGALLKVSVRQ